MPTLKNLTLTNLPSCLFQTGSNKSTSAASSKKSFSSRPTKRMIRCIPRLFPRLLQPLHWTTKRSLSRKRRNSAVQPAAKPSVFTPASTVTLVTSVISSRGSDVATVLTEPNRRPVFTSTSGGCIGDQNPLVSTSSRARL